MRFVLLVVLECAAIAASVWTGVYGQPQAARGRKLYDAQCARCHGDGLLGGEGSPPLAGRDFLEKWSGRSVADLVEITRKTMPSDGPGRLTRRQSTDIAAYILSANRFPAGESELQPDLESLKEILIEPKR